MLTISKEIFTCILTIVEAAILAASIYDVFLENSDAAVYLCALLILLLYVNIRYFLVLRHQRILQKQQALLEQQLHENNIAIEHARDASLAEAIQKETSAEEMDHLLKDDTKNADKEQPL